MPAALASAALRRNGSFVPEFSFSSDHKETHQRIAFPVAVQDVRTTLIFDDAHARPPWAPIVLCWSSGKRDSFSGGVRTLEGGQSFVCERSMAIAVGLSE